VFYIRGGTLSLVVDINSNSTFSGNTATLGDVISTCRSDIDVNVTNFGLEMQPDPEYPQYCSVYDEIYAAANGSINTITETTTIASTSTRQSIATTPYETSTHPEGTTPNSQSSTHPEITTDFETTSKPDTKSTTVEVTTNKPTHYSSATAPTDKDKPGLESNNMSVTYVSLGISLVSMIATVTVCIIVLLLFCRLWKKVNANANRTYSLGERRLSFSEDEYSFAVEDSSNIPASQHEEEKHLIPA
jgi:hypothetical protein